MKIKLDIENRTIECEREPMPPERFSALCKLVGAWAVGGALVAMLFYGLYQIMKF